MASLVLGAAGAIVGNALLPGIGGAVGWLAGSMVGNLIDPPKVEGPRLSDLKLQRSAYGAMIPYVWGTGRIAGNIIDQTDLVEHSHKNSGKGGPTTTTYTYTASFAILLCETPVFGQDAIRGIRRIWWNSRLFWSDTGGTPIPCTVYTGSETQMPDPTFEAVHSPDPVPAYRGFAYVVFTDKDLTEGGNTIGNWEFEVYTEAGSIPWRVSTYERPHGLSDFCGIGLNDDGTTTLNYLDWTSGTTSPVARTVEVRALDDAGTLVSTDSTGLATWNGGPAFIAAICDNNPHITEITASNGGGTYGAWYYDNTQVANPISGGGNALVVSTRCVFYNDSVYTTGMAGGPVIRRYPSPGGVTSGTSVASYALGGVASANWAISVSEDGFLYAFDADNPGSLYKLTTDDLTLITTYSTDVPDLGGAGFAVWNGMVCFERIDGGGQHYASVYRIDPSGFVLVDELAIDDLGGTGFISLGNGLVRFADGIISLVPPPGDVRLSTIVANLADMTPGAGQYDVSDLESTFVHWYVVASQMTVRNAIQPLRTAFFFDGVESDLLVKFRLRTGTSAFTIADDDLETRAHSAEPPPLLRTIRAKEQDLPRTVALNYINIDADYLPGVESSPRQTSQSESDVTIQVPIGFTPAEAAKRAWSLQAQEWLQREQFEFTTPRKWLKLEPCDTGTVRGRILRCQTRTEQPDGTTFWNGVAAAGSIYTQVAGGNPGGFVPQIPPSGPQTTDLLLLDIPYIPDATQQQITSVAMAGHARPSWAGASLQRSIDGGTTYSELFASTVATTMGLAVGALGDWAGGNMFDEVNAVTIIIAAGGGELESATRAAVVNGSNLALLGAPGRWELLQFRDAPLLATDTYLITGFLRGRNGTEWTCATHVAGDVFVLLPTGATTVHAFSDYGLARLYKAVTIGNTLASATAQTYTPLGVPLTPYFPVHMGSGQNAAGDWILSWTRRARVNASWQNYIDVPLDEASEAYKIYFYTDGTYSTYVTELSSSVPTMTMSVAQQTAIFGSPQSELFWLPAQVGLLGPGYDPLGQSEPLGAAHG